MKTSLVHLFTSDASVYAGVHSKLQERMVTLCVVVLCVLGGEGTEQSKLSDFSPLLEYNTHVIQFGWAAVKLNECMNSVLLPRPRVHRTSILFDSECRTRLR